MTEIDQATVERIRNKIPAIYDLSPTNLIRAVLAASGWGERLAETEAACEAKQQRANIREQKLREAEQRVAELKRVLDEARQYIVSSGADYKHGICNLIDTALADAPPAPDDDRVLVKVRKIERVPFQYDDDEAAPDPEPHPGDSDPCYDVSSDNDAYWVKCGGPAPAPERDGWRPIADKIREKISGVGPGFYAGVYGKPHEWRALLDALPSPPRETPT